MIVLKILNFPRSLIIWFFISVLNLQDIIIDDLKRYCHYESLNSFKTLCIFNKVLIEKKVFHNQCIFRIKKKNRLLGKISQVFLWSKKDLEICGGEIDGGMKIFHGHCTVVVCQKAGKNLTIYQGVTIGKNNKKGLNGNGPIIGNNVTIYTNAVVAGEIIIGNNVKIGAGSVVLTNVPDNTIVYGNPCVMKKINDVV